MVWYACMVRRMQHFMLWMSKENRQCSMCCPYGKKKRKEIHSFIFSEGCGSRTVSTNQYSISWWCFIRNVVWCDVVWCDVMWCVYYSLDGFNSSLTNNGRCSTTLWWRSIVYHILEREKIMMHYCTVMPHTCIELLLKQIKTKHSLVEF